jgi:hypothetical protein
MRREQDSRTLQITVRLRYFNDSGSKLAVREFGAALFVAREDGDAELIKGHTSFRVISDPKMEDIKTEGGG